MPNDQGLAEDASDLDRLEALIKADEAESAAARPSGSLKTGDQAAQNDALRDSQSNPDPAAETPASQTEQTKPNTETPPKDPPKEPSRYEKQRQRQEKSWQALNEEKSRLAAEKAALAAEREQIAAQKKTEAEAAPKWTPEQLEDYAKKFEEQGKLDFAQQARIEADRLRKAAAAKAAAPAAQSAPARPAQDAKFEQLQAQSWEAAKKEFPDIMSKGSPLNSEVVSFLKENPEVLDVPQGPRWAAHFVSARLEAKHSSARLAEVTKQLEGLKAENQRLIALTTPGGGGLPTGETSEPAFADLSLSDMQKAIESEIAGLT